MNEGPYEACFTSEDVGVYGVKGPGNGLGFYAAYLYPENTFDSFILAEKVARMMNIAYNEGKKARSREIKELIG